MNKREKTLLIRRIEFILVMLVLVAGLTTVINAPIMEGGILPMKLIFGAAGMVLIIVVAFAFSKFMFKNLPEDEPEKPTIADLAKEDVRAGGRMAEIKYGTDGKKKPGSEDFKEYYSIGKK